MFRWEDMHNSFVRLLPECWWVIFSSHISIELGVGRQNKDSSKRVDKFLLFSVKLYYDDRDNYVDIVQKYIPKSKESCLTVRRWFHRGWLQIVLKYNRRVNNRSGRSWKWKREC